MPERSHLPAIARPSTMWPTSGKTPALSSQEDIAPGDADLLAAAARGDNRAFDLLYQRHRQWVYRLAHRFTGNDADAWDVLQEAFLYLARKSPSLTLTASLRTLLFRVIQSLAITANKKRRRLILGDELLAAVPQPPPGPATDDLHAILESLDLPHRQVILLRYVDALSIEEIADLLSIPSGTVKSRLFHAHHLLRDNPRARRYFDQP